MRHPFFEPTKTGFESEKSSWVKHQWPPVHVTKLVGPLSAELLCWELPYVPWLRRRRRNSAELCTLHVHSLNTNS